MVANPREIFVNEVVVDSQKGEADIKRFGETVAKAAVETDKAAKKTKQFSDETKGLSAAARQRVKQTEDMTRSMDRLVRTYNPAAATAKKLEQAEELVNAARRRGITVTKAHTQAIDNLRSRMERQTRAANDNSRAANDNRRAVGALESAWTRLKAIVAGAVIYRAIRGLIGGFGAFEEKMDEVAAVSQATAAQMAAMETTARRLGATTKFSATEAAEGVAFLGRAGFAANDNMAALPGTLNLAAAGALGLGDAADIASNVLTGFGMAATEMNRVADVMAATAANSNTSVQQLGDAMKFAAPVAASLGISIEDTAAGIGKLSDAGLQGEMAGTGLRMALVALVNPSNAAKEAVESLGLRLSDVNPQTTSLTDIMQRLRDAGLGASEAMQIAGARGGTALLALARQADGIRDLANTLRGAEGTAERMATQMSDNLPGAAKRFMSALSEIGLMITGDGGLGGALKSLLDTSASILISWTQFSHTLGENENTVKRYASVIEALAATFGTYLGILGAMKAATIAWAAATTIATGGLNLVIPAIAAAVGFLVAFRDETFEIGGVTLRVGAVISAVWTTVKETVWGVVQNLALMADSLGKFLKGDFKGAVESYGKAGEALRTSFGEIADSWRAVANEGDSVREVLGGVGDDSVETAKAIQGLVDAANGLTGTGDKVSSAFGGVAKALKEQAEQAFAMARAYASGGEEVALTARAIEIYKQASAAGVSITLQQALAMDNLGVSVKGTASEIAQMVARTEQANRALENAKIISGLRDQLDLVRAELELVGESSAIRERALEILKVEIDLKSRGIDLTSKQAKEEIRLTKTLIDSRAQLERMRAAASYMQDAFTRAFDRIGEAITQAFATGEISALDFKDLTKAIISELIQDFLKLAAINPLKNLLFGGSLPTLTSVFPSIGGLFGAGSGAASLGAGGSSLFGAAQPFTSAASFGSQMFSGGLATPLVYSQTGASMGLSQAIPGAANGAIASGSGVAPTALGSGLLQLSSLAVLPFLGMGIAALASIAMKKDLPRSAAQIGVQDGMFGVDAVHTLNGGDPAVGQAIGEAASGIANAFLEASGARLTAGAQLGMIGLDQKWIGTTTSSGLYDHSLSDQLGIRGLTKDNRTFDNTEGGQRAAAADFATRNLLNKLLNDEITGLTESASETIKFGLGNLARNIESTMSEIDFEAFSRQFEMLAGWDNLREQMVSLDDVAGDTAKRLEKAEVSQRAFNEQIAALRVEADAAIAESGSGLKDIGTFVDDAMALFDPTGGNRFQLRLQLGEGAGTGSIDGNGTAYTIPAENGNRPTLASIFDFGTQSRGEGEGADLQNQLIVFNELIETIDQNLGENGKLIEAFHEAGDNLDFSISKLADILEGRGVELQPILDDFFDLDISRERISEIEDMAKYKVDKFFDQIADAAASFGGSRTLFEDIVPAVSPIVEQFEVMKAKIEATRPGIQALNEDLAAMGASVIDVDAKINEAKANVAAQAQNQFLADLGIAVDKDGNVSSANVGFSAISQVAQWTKGADENARVLFESDPRNLLPGVTSEINRRTEQSINEILSAADDYDATLEQINMIFGDRIADFDLVAQGSNAQLVDQAALARATFAAQQAVMEQQRERLGILQEEANILEGVANAANDNFRTLSQASSGLLVNSNLSTLSAGERVAEASRQLEAAYALANDNDPMDAESQAAINNLPGLVNTQLELSRAYNASSEAYQEDFARGQEILNKTAANQNSIAQQQLSALEGIHSEIESLNASLSAAATGPTYVKGGDGQHVSTGLNGMAAGIDLGYDAEANLRIYKALTAAGINYTGAGEGQIGDLRRSNPTADAIITAMGFADGGVFRGGNVIPFANGTVINQPTLFPMGGNRRGLMGEAGPEAIMPLTRIGGRLGVVASGGNSNRELIRELSMLREEVRMLRAERREDSRRQTAVTAQGALEVRRAVTDGNQTQGRMAEAAERAAAAPKGKAA